MRTIVVAVAVAACAVAGASTPPPRGAADALRGYYSALAPGDTLPYTYTLPAFGARANATIFSLKAADAVTASGWRLAAPGCDRRAGNTTCTLATAVPNTNGVWWTTSTLSSPFVLVRTDTVPWDSATFRLVAWGANTTVNRWSADSVVLATWRVIRRPSPPPPGTLDSTAVVAVYVKPDSAHINLAVSDSTIFCAYARLVNQAVVPSPLNMPVCSLTPVGLRGRYFVEPVPLQQLSSLGYRAWWP